MTLTIITGWIAAILLVFNFATCFVMPWSKKHIKECDGKGCCHETTLGKYHKPIAWLSILAIIFHIVVALIGK
jgi:hypothetical protein